MNELQILGGPALLVAALIIVGRCLKAWGAFPDKLIPTALALAGAVAYYFMAGRTATSFLIGITLGGTAVWGNQQWRQLVPSNNAETTPSPKTGPGASLLALGCVGAIGVALCAGCTTVIKSDKGLILSESFFGAKVSATSATTQTPEIKLGGGKSIIILFPTSTNGPVNAPKIGDTFDISQGWNPFGSSIKASLFLGDVEIRTNATGGAIVPKSPAAPIVPASPIDVQRR